MSPNTGEGLWHRFRFSSQPRLWLTLLLVVVALGVLAPQLDPRPLTFFDGLGYFSYLPALFEGRPFDLQEFAYPPLHAQWRNYPGTGRTVNPWGVGPALSWLPWYAGARLLYPGLGPMDQLLWRSCALGTLVTALAGVVLLFWALAAVLPRWAAGAGALAGLVATPVLAYAANVPFTSLALSFALVSAVLWLTLTRDLGRPWVWLAMGMACGLLAASRPQAMIFAALPLARRRPSGGQAALGGLGFLLLFFPQMLYWRMTFGSWLVLAQQQSIPEFFRVPAVGSVLFSPKHGLFSTHPLLLVGAGGLVALALRPGWRRLGVMALGLVAVETVVNALPFDWWGGWSFGARRFCEAMPLFALGIGYAFSRLPWLTLAGVAAAWWNLALLWAWTTDIPQYQYCFQLYGRSIHPVSPLSVAVVGAVARHLATTPGLAAGTAGSLALAGWLLARSRAGKRGAREEQAVSPAGRQP